MIFQHYKYASKLNKILWNICIFWIECHIVCNFSICSPTEEKLASKSRSLTCNELENCVNEPKKLYAEFWVSQRTSELPKMIGVIGVVQRNILSSSQGFLPCGPVIQRADNAVQQKIHYPVDKH